MEGRGDSLKRLNLGRSIDHSCKGFQHFWVGIGVVSFCIGFALPQIVSRTDLALVTGSSQLSAIADDSPEPRCLQQLRCPMRLGDGMAA
jgi:hypothetical protein